MSSASCPAKASYAEDEAPRPVPLSPHAWSVLTQVRPDIFVDGWLREASITDLRTLGVDRIVLTAVFVRANGMFDQRTWSLSAGELGRALGAAPPRP